MPMEATDEAGAAPEQPCLKRAHEEHEEPGRPKRARRRSLVHGAAPGARQPADDTAAAAALPAAAATEQPIDAAAAAAAAAAQQAKKERKAAERAAAAAEAAVVAAQLKEQLLEAHGLFQAEAEQRQLFLEVYAGGCWAPLGTRVAISCPR